MHTTEFNGYKICEELLAFNNDAIYNTCTAI